MPSWERDEVKRLSLTDAESEALMERSEQAFGSLTRHQISGYPSCIQGDSMELECQLVTNGLYCGDPSGYNDPRAKTLEAGRADWKLLLQIDTDEDNLGVMWGDVGRVYFWVRHQDASEARFENAWMILQCY